MPSQSAGKPLTRLSPYPQQLGKTAAQGMLRGVAAKGFAAYCLRVVREQYRDNTFLHKLTIRTQHAVTILPPDKDTPCHESLLMQGCRAPAMPGNPPAAIQHAHSTHTLTSSLTPCLLLSTKNVFLPVCSQGSWSR